MTFAASIKNCKQNQTGDQNNSKLSAYKYEKPGECSKKLRKKHHKRITTS